MFVAARSCRRHSNNTCNNRIGPVLDAPLPMAEFDVNLPDKEVDPHRSPLGEAISDGSLALTGKSLIVPPLVALPDTARTR